MQELPRLALGVKPEHVPCYQASSRLATRDPEKITARSVTERAVRKQYCVVRYLR